MATDITTSLNAALYRAVHNIIDDIAKDGLRSLKHVLDSSGFAKSEYLKNYEIYAHATQESIEFEIIIDVEAIESKESVVTVQEDEPEEENKKVTRTYSLPKSLQPMRIEEPNTGKRDARRSATDARRSRINPLRRTVDKRKDSKSRLIEHEAALGTPRSMNVNRSGKISVRFKRSLHSAKEPASFSRKKFDGIIQDFIEELHKIVAEKFAPELEKLIVRYIT